MKANLIAKTGLTFIFFFASLAMAAEPVPMSELEPVEEGPMVFRHKDPAVTGLFANDCDGNVYRVVLSFRGLGFGTESPVAPIEPDALETLIVVYSNWLRDENGPQGAVREKIEKAVAIAKGERPSDPAIMTAEARRREDAYQNEQRQMRDERRLELSPPLMQFVVIGKHASTMWDLIKNDSVQEWVEIDEFTRKKIETKKLASTNLNVECRKVSPISGVECLFEIKNYLHGYHTKGVTIAEFQSKQAEQIFAQINLTNSMIFGEEDGFVSYGDCDIQGRSQFCYLFFNIEGKKFVHFQYLTDMYKLPYKSVGYRDAKVILDPLTVYFEPRPMIRYDRNPVGRSPIDDASALRGTLFGGRVREQSK